MKRFLLFFGSNYYPAGGMADFQGDFATLEEALKFSTIRTGWDWIQIYDTTIRATVYFND